MSELIKYRKDIDGLRAIAILSVVIFHLNNDLLSGGFVGVDIFFVISGFLITKIIIREINNNNFSFTSFYIRRIRRIFPLLFVVLFSCIIFSYLILTAEDMLWFGKTLRYSAFQVSNFLFQKNVGYFDPSFDGMLLLHTWSLAVEEQFYLIWPIVLFLILKFRKNQNIVFYSLILLSIISLIFSQYLLNNNPKLSFFSLPSRFWELGIGGILAFHKIKQPSKNINEAFGVSGIILIIISFFMIDKDHFPGVYALMPCLGAALIIFSGHRCQTITTKFLSKKIFIFFGLISYSLYLWHFPIIIFYKEFIAVKDLSIISSLIIFTISVIISCLSYRYIEVPFRRKPFQQEKIFIFSFNNIITRSKNNKSKLFSLKLYSPIIASIVCVGLLIMISFDIKDKNGWEKRIDIKESKFLKDKKVFTKTWHNASCFMDRQDFNKGKRFSSDISKCILGKNKDNLKVLLIGDSNAGHYSAGLVDFVNKHGFAVAMLASPSCPAINDPYVINRPSLMNERCNHLINTAKKVLTKYENIKYVVLGGDWSGYISMLADDKKAFKNNFSEIIKYFTKLNKKIIILGKSPKLNDATYYPLKCLKSNFTPLKRYLYNKKNDEEIILARSTKCLEYNRKYSTLYYKYLHDFFSNLSNKSTNIQYFDPIPYLCDSEKCYAAKDGKLLFLDWSHLNTYGSMYISQYFDFKLD